MLPIGSIIYLKDGNQKMMILNVGPVIENEGKKFFFDYSAAMYPTGLNPDQVYYFNAEDIDEVVFKGYEDEDSRRMEKVYKQWIEDNKDEYQKGIVE